MAWYGEQEFRDDYTRGAKEERPYTSLQLHSDFQGNDFRYSDDNLTPFFERIKAQNEYFPDCAYTLIGFAKNKNGKVCAVIQQPYIISWREATEEEFKTELERLGFKSQMDGEHFTNGIHDIFDASPNNVLVGIDGNLYFIDTIIYKSDEGNVNTYHSQSLHFNGSKSN